VIVSATPAELLLPFAIAPIPILGLTPPRSQEKSLLSFHALTWSPFCNPFVFTFMHVMGGVPPPQRSGVRGEGRLQITRTTKREELRGGEEPGEAAVIILYGIRSSRFDVGSDAEETRAREALRFVWRGGFGVFSGGRPCGGRVFCVFHRRSTGIGRKKSQPRMQSARKTVSDIGTPPRLV
jgi:hypothetical protein